MAGKNIIKVLIDGDAAGLEGGVRKARTALDGFKANIASADGAGGKFKAGMSSIGDTLKANVAAAAVGAGAALVAFGVKAVSAFQETALEAGKFADAAGIAVDDASRWMEVVGDLGIESSIIEGAFLKMNKAIGAGTAPLQEFGGEIVKTKSGLVDANATFINAISTIGAIEDPTLRAKAAQETFGRSYGEVAELMEMDADDLTAALAGVSDSKVIDQAELDKARDFRARLDELKDKFEDFALSVGQLVVEMGPALTLLAKTATAAAGLASKAATAALGTDDMTDAYTRFADEVNSSSPTAALADLFNASVDAKGGISALKDVSVAAFREISFASDNGIADERWQRVVAVFEDLKKVAPETAAQMWDSLGIIAAGADAGDESVTGLADDLGITLDRFKELGGRPSTDLASALDGVGTSADGAGRGVRTFSDAAWTAEQATKAAEDAIKGMDDAYSDLKGNLDDRAAWRNLEEDLISLKEKIDSGEASWLELGAATDEAIGSAAEYIATAEDIPTEVKTYLYQELDKGNLDYVTTVLEDLKKGVNVPLYLNTVGKFDLKGARASGGPVGPGDWLVGENGPELLRLGSGANGNVVPAGETARMLGPGTASGGVTNNYFSVTTGMDPRQFQEMYLRLQRTGRIR